MKLNAHYFFLDTSAHSYFERERESTNYNN